MIQNLQTVLPYLIFIFLFFVFLVLIIGIVSMLRGGEFNNKWGNKLMRARVAFQAISVILIVLFGYFLSR